MFQFEQSIIAWSPSLWLKRFHIIHTLNFYRSSAGGLVTKLSLTLATPWAVVHQVPLPMGFSRQEHCSGFPFPSPGDLPIPGIELGSPVLQADSLLTELRGKSFVVGIDISLQSSFFNLKNINLFQNTSLVSGRAVTWTQSVWFKLLCVLCLLCLSNSTCSVLL